MKRQSIPSNISVRYVRRCSLDHKYQKSSIKKVPSNKAIRIDIRTLRNISSINRNNNFSKQFSTIINNHQNEQIQRKSRKRSKHSHSNTQIDQSCHSFSQITKRSISSVQQNPSLEISLNQICNPDISSQSSRISPYQNINIIDQRKKNEKGLTYDFHRTFKKKRKKTKCSKFCIIASIIGILLTLIIIAIILLILLIKPSSNKITPNYTPVLRWNTTGITVAGIVNSPGNGTNQLNDPADVVLDYENNLYIADRKNNRIQKYLFGSRNGTTVAGNGIFSNSSYQLLNPSRVILDSNRNLYISDTSNHRIQFWPNGAISATTVAGITGSWGNASNRLYNPMGIALNPTTGSLYISDQFNHRIISYAFGANNGTLVFGGNGPGINNTQLYYPYGLHFDLFSNSLIITNYYVNNIVQYVFGAKTWALIAGNISGFAGTTSTYLNNPYEAIFDPMGNVYVADRNNHRIQFFNADQLDGTTIAGITGVNGSNSTTLALPRSLRLDSQLNLYVADTNNHRIQKFLRY